MKSNLSAEYSGASRILQSSTNVAGAVGALFFVVTAMWLAKIAAFWIRTRPSTSKSYRRRLNPSGRGGCDVNPRLKLA